jgi:hypothetical protein
MTSGAGTGSQNPGNLARLERDVDPTGARSIGLALPGSNAHAEAMARVPVWIVRL